MMMNKTRTLGVEKFDVVVMNPPYNSGSDNSGSAHTLWDKFVIKVLEDKLAEDGYLVAVHPDGWRALGVGFQKVKTLLKSKQIIYLQLCDEGDGIKTFGYSTAFDFYCVQNTTNKGNFITKIKGTDGKTIRKNISNVEFIPNGMFEEFYKLIAENDEEKVNVLYDCNYHIQKQYVSKLQNADFKYPLVYVTYKDGSMQLRYSNINTKGHFGIPKVIWSNGSATTPFVDKDGEYGMCQFAYAIIDKLQNLSNIRKAMLNPKFIKLMAFSDGKSGPGRQNRFNRKVIALFRKDFWVDFLDYNNDDE